MPTIAIFELDLRNMPAVIDRHGPAVAEGLAEMVAARLASVAGAGNDVIREGVQKMVVVRPLADSPGVAERLAIRLHQCALDPIELETGVYAIDATINLKVIQLQQWNKVLDPLASR